jgi:hypothetical protein
MIPWVVVVEQRGDGGVGDGADSQFEHAVATVAIVAQGVASDAYAAGAALPSVAYTAGAALAAAAATETDEKILNNSKMAKVLTSCTR